MEYVPVKNHPVVQAANGQPLNMVGTALFTVRLSPSLEIDLEGVAVHDVPGSCLALIGMDLLNGQKGVWDLPQLLWQCQAVQVVVKSTLNSFPKPFWRWSQIIPYQFSRNLLAKSRVMISNLGTSWSKLTSSRSPQNSNAS